MDTELHSRWLPNGRFELTLGKCVPVIVRPGTFFAKTASELYCLTGLLTLIADYFRKMPDIDLPMETGTLSHVLIQHARIKKLADRPDGRPKCFWHFTKTFIRHHPLLLL